MAISLFAGLV